MTKGLEGEEHDYQHDVLDDEELEEKVQEAIKALPTVQEKLQAIALNGYLQQKKALDKQLEKEMNAIELKHRKTMEPFFAKINEIVEGVRQLTVEDFEGVESLLTEQELSVRNHYFKAERFQDYWLKALKNSEFGFEITDKDEEILKHLQRIEGHKSEDETKLSLKFYFGENQWFTNKEIIKEFLLEGDQIKKSYGDAIEWKEGKNVTVKIVKKKQKNKKTGEKKTSTKEVRQESFFHIFDAIDLDDDEENSKEEDEEATDQKIEELEHQHQLAECIYDDVIQNSLSLYLGLGGLGDLGFEGADLDQQSDVEEDEKPTKKKSAGKKKKNDDDEEDKSEKSKSKSKQKTSKAEKPKKGGKGGKGEQPQCKNQ